MYFKKVFLSCCLLAGGLNLARCVPNTNAYPFAVARDAESFFGNLRSEIAGGIELRLKEPTLAARDLNGIVVLLNTCTNKLHEAGFDQKLNAASRQVETVQTQVLSVLKDPGNKELFALGFEPEKCLGEIKLQKSSAAVLEKNIIHLRDTVDELRKGAAILEPVTPTDQLSDKLKLRLNQLLSEWNQNGSSPNQEREEPQWSRSQPVNERPEPRARPVNRVSITPAVTPAATRPAPEPEIRASAARSNSGPAPDLSPAVVNVIRMAHDHVSEGLIVKRIAVSQELFHINSVEPILYLRSIGISSPVISAMLQRDRDLQGPGLHIFARGRW